MSTKITSVMAASVGITSSCPAAFSTSHLYPVFPSFPVLAPSAEFDVLLSPSLLRAAIESLHPQLAVWGCEEKAILGYRSRLSFELNLAFFGESFAVELHTAPLHFARSPSLHVKLFVQPIGPSNYDLPYAVHQSPIAKACIR